MQALLYCTVDMMLLLLTAWLLLPSVCLHPHFTSQLIFCIPFQPFAYRSGTFTFILVLFYLEPRLLVSSTTPRLSHLKSGHCPIRVQRHFHIAY